jgi:hypothetical protein
MANPPINNSAANDKAIINNAIVSRRVRRMLGLSLHGWEDFMIAALAGVAFFGVLVGVATWAVVTLQRAEIAASKDEFERYKLDAGKRIAGANAAGDAAKADAAKANEKAEAERLERLKLEAILGPRSLTLAQQQAIAQLLKPFSGKRVAVTTYSLDGEGATLATQIMAVLQAASVTVDNRLASIMPMGGFSLGVHVEGSDSDLVSAIRQGLAFIGGLMVAPPNTQQSGGAALGLAPPEGEKAPDASILVGIKPVRTIR